VGAELLAHRASRATQQWADAAIDFYSRRSGLKEVTSRARDALLTARALSLAFEGIDREGVLSELVHEPWIIRHELLTRWCWIRAQRSELEKKPSLNNPWLYLCRVRDLGGEGERRVDVEFSTCLLFLNALRTMHGREWLLVEKVSDDPPDLIVEDEAGRRIGIECTESSLETPHSQWQVEAKQNRCRQAWVPYLRAAGYALILDDTDRGPLSRDLVREPVADRLKLTSTARPSDQPVRLEIPDLGFFATLEPSNEPYVYFSMWCGDNTRALQTGGVI
jgi:hypothetical protein